MKLPIILTLMSAASASVVLVGCSKQQNVSIPVKCENGTFVGHMNDGIQEWLGIPYAKPPVGSLRWKEPQKPEKSSDEKYCDHFSNSPIQVKGYDFAAKDMSEDCLYLNVWAAPGDMKNRSVMVWIHGGAFICGSTSERGYQGINFVKAHPDIILVSIEYRLGMYGFIDFSDVAGGDQFPTSAVNGLLDQALAIKWVHDNIEGFGGNKNNITIFGQSAGGQSAATLAVLPKDYKPPMQKVICESGFPGLNVDKSFVDLGLKHLLEVTKAQSMNDLMAYSESELRDIYLNKGVWNHLYSPTYNNKIFSQDDTPLMRYKKGEAEGIKFMSGATADECHIWMTDGMKFNIESLKLYARACYDYSSEKIPEEAKAKAETYLKMCRNNDDRGSAILELENDLGFRSATIKAVEAQSQFTDCYSYYWDYPSSYKDIGSTHSAELIFVFNNPADPKNLTNGTNTDPKVYKVIQDLWTSFAINGVPKSDNLEWSPYTLNNKSTLVIGGPEETGERSIRNEKDWMLEQTNKAFELLEYKECNRFIFDYFECIHRFIE